MNELVKEYGLSDNLFRLQSVSGSLLVGQTVQGLDVRRKYGLNILEVRRGEASQHRFLKTVTQKLASPDTVIQAGDVLYVTGDAKDVTTETARTTGNSLDFYDIGIAEIVLMPSSNIINQRVKEAGFRDKFNVNVLGIRRKKEYILQDLGKERMHSGDVLLVQGTWQDIARLSKEDTDWVSLLPKPLR